MFSFFAWYHTSLQPLVPIPQECASFSAIFCSVLDVQCYSQDRYPDFMEDQHRPPIGQCRRTRDQRWLSHQIVSTSIIHPFQLGAGDFERPKHDRIDVHRPRRHNFGYGNPDVTAVDPGLLSCNDPGRIFRIAPRERALSEACGTGGLSRCSDQASRSSPSCSP